MVAVDDATRSDPEAEAARAEPPLRLAYLTTTYPEVSHTFIRREIQELEARGHRVERLSVREPGSELVDPLDRAERERTWYCLRRLPRELAFALPRDLGRFLSALRTTIEMARVSHRGWLVGFAYLLEALVVKRRLDSLGVQHLHVHFGTNAAAVARLVRRLGGPPYSLTVHGPAELDAAIGFSLGGKIEDAEFVVAISDYCGAQLRRWVGPEHWHKIRVVRCAVEERLFEQATPVDPDSRTVVCVGRLTAQKGQLLLLEALRLLVRDGVDLRLVLAGDGEMRPEIEQRIAEFGLGDRVEITGWIDSGEVVRRLRSARAMVLPSFAEGLPVVIMEALALERPVLSTYIAGIPELVEPGESGWLVPAGNAVALARALRDVMETPAERLDAMGRAGARAVRARHLLPVEVSRLEAHLLDATGIDRRDEGKPDEAPAAPARPTAEVLP